MFNLVNSTTVANHAALRGAIVSLLVSDGWINHNNASGANSISLESPDGQFLSIAITTGTWNNYLTVFFGDGINSSNNLIAYPTGFESRYLDISGSLGLQGMPLNLQLYKNSHAQGDLYVLRVQSTADRLPLPMFLVFGVAVNDPALPDVGKVFIWTGSGEVSLDGVALGTRTLCFATTSTTSSGAYDNRSRLQCRGTQAGGQTTENYTTLTSTGSTATSGTGHVARISPDEQPLTNADSAPSSGVPLAEWLICISTPTGSVYTLGSLPGIFYGATPLPDGVVIERDGRYFQVCRSNPSKRHGCFLIELSGV